MDRKMGMQRGQAENLVSQAKQKLKYDLIEGKVGLDRAYSLVNSMKMVESQWQKMAGSQPQSQSAGQGGGQSAPEPECRADRGRPARSQPGPGGNDTYRPPAEIWAGVPGCDSRPKRGRAGNNSSPAAVRQWLFGCGRKCSKAFWQNDQRYKPGKPDIGGAS